MRHTEPKWSPKLMKLSFQEVRNLRQDVNTNDSLAYKLEVEKRQLSSLLELVKTDGSFKEKLQAKINEAEESGKKLREEQRNVRDDQQDAAKQMKQWRDLMRLMEVKKSCLLRNNPNVSNKPSTPQALGAPTPVSSRAQSSKLERCACEPKTVIVTNKHLVLHLGLQPWTASAGPESALRFLVAE